MMVYYTPGYGVDALVANGVVKLMFYNNVLGYVEDVGDGRLAVYSPVEVATLSITDAVAKAIDDIPDRELRDRLLRDIASDYMLYAKLGYYYGALRYRIADRELQYVLTFAPKPGRRVDTRPLMRLLYSVRGYVKTWEPLYGTVEYVISHMLREVRFSLRYNYYTLDDVCIVLWTIDGNDVYARRLCDLEFVKHIYDPRR